MKVNYERPSKWNNELKLHVDEQQDDIKHLNKKCDKDNEEKVQEITALITPLKKKKPMCVTYNQTFVTKNGLKTHIQEEPPELW